MEKSTALEFLENLIERIERDPKTGKLNLDGLLTEKEYQALGAALESLGGMFDPLPKVNAIKQDHLHETIHIPAIETSLNLDSLSCSEPEEPKILLCLDFGTAMSKAFATEESDDNLISLPIGKQAGQTFPIFSLASSIFITDSGYILFGQQAVTESTHTDSSNRKRFDSIKDILCKDVVCNLDEAPLEEGYNPTKLTFTKGDMVTLFLAYFTDMATSQLQEQNHSRYVKRRFTMPVLPPEDRAPWAKDQLRLLLARAQILADTLHGEWENGINIETAKHALNEIKNLREIPTFLVADGVVEPVAAVGSRFREYVCEENSRRLLMVIDVGAGTVDYALFAEVREKGKPLQFWEIPGSVQVLRQAGDFVDKLLRRYILKKVDITHADNDYRMIDADLSLRIRELKETLFREQQVKFVLTNDMSGLITIDEFLNAPGVKELEKAIGEKFERCLNDVDESWINELGKYGLAVVLSGGGAGLPIVRSLNPSVMVQGRPLEVRLATLVPSWIKEEEPELADEYSQLAVAIGGSSRSLPQLAPETFERFGGLEAEDWHIPPAYKGT